MVGAIVSYSLEDGGEIAVASGSAFLLSEFADLAVYFSLRAEGKIKALLASNAVGLVADLILFYIWLLSPTKGVLLPLLTRQ